MERRRFNKGRTFVRSLIKKSIQELGCARSIVLDMHGDVLCGNDVASVARELGKKVVVIETDGDVLIAVKRTDIDADSKKGKEIALVDNLAAEKNLNWDADAILEAMDNDIAFDARDWGGYECIVKELDLHELLADAVERKEKPVKKEENLDLSCELSLFD